MPHPELAVRSTGLVWKLGEPLAPAIVGHKTQLSPAAKQALRRLMKRQPFWFLWKLTFTWSTIAAATLAALYLQSAWLTFIAVILVATRQNVLALLLHEQAHRLAFRSRWGDIFCNFTIAYPLLITLEGYRRVHLAHHQHYFTDKDPDYVRKQGEEWTSPQRLASLVRSLLLEATGIHTLQILKSKDMRAESGPTKTVRSDLWRRVAFYVGLVAILTASGYWPIFLLYWLLPLVTVFQVIVRWAAICEHKYNLVRPTVAESTPFIRLRWWESLILPDLSFHTYHIYHHWYPAIPYRRLSEVDEIFRREGLVREQNIFNGYHSYLHYLTKPTLSQTDSGTCSPLARGERE
jgi:fatty acid desaturase